MATVCGEAGGRAQVGVVTSATRLPVQKKNIALRRMDVACAALGTEVEVGKIDGHKNVERWWFV